MTNKIAAILVAMSIYSMYLFHRPDELMLTDEMHSDIAVENTRALITSPITASLSGLNCIYW
jgi:hypothetical protein